MILSFMKNKAENRLELTLKTIVVGFLVSCFFNYPAHLWLPATWVMFFYAAFYALKNEELINVR